MKRYRLRMLCTVFLLLSIISVRAEQLSVQEQKIIKPRVSIITSVFNGDEFIKGFLEDIVQESIFNECELILINAHSPGNEDAVIQEYLPKYQNIKYLKLDHDPGLYAVWNMAIKLAESDLIANANIDDRRNHQSLEIMAQALEADKNIDLVYGDYLITYIANETFERNNYRWIVQPPDFQPLLIVKCLPGPQPMWRKSMHEKYGFFNEEFFSYGDYEMWVRAVTQGAQFKKIPNFITGLFYQNPHGLSTDQNPDKMQKRNAEEARIVQTYFYLWR